MNMHKQLDDIIDNSTSNLWVKKVRSYPELSSWIINRTEKYIPINFMERIYIIKTGILPPYCSQGNKLKFISYSKGYQKISLRREMGKQI